MPITLISLAPYAARPFAIANASPEVRRINLAVAARSAAFPKPVPDCLFPKHLVRHQEKGMA
jgi:hypothetical protein